MSIMKFIRISFCIVAMMGCLSLNSIAQQKSETLEPFFKQLELNAGIGGFWHRSKPIVPTTFQHYIGFQSLGVGAYVELMLNQRIALTTGFRTSPGKLFSNSIWLETTNPLYRYDVVTLEFREWEVPFTLKYYFLNGKIRPFILVNLGINGTSNFKRYGTHVNPLRPPYLEDFLEEQIKTSTSEAFDIGGGVKVDLKDNVNLTVSGSFQNLTVNYGGFDGKLDYFILKRPVIRAELYIRLHKWENENFKN